ncbi:MAG: DsbA family protein [Alphaproteobacteria bacterium]|nr:DsbA family protein [Alphaproteobacteria bacterium]
MSDIRLYRRLTLRATALTFSALVAFSAPVLAQNTEPAKKADSVLTRGDVESIVRDFITQNPQLILTSVDAYQQRTMQEQQTAAVEMNKDRLFRNERSPFIGNEKGDVTIVEFFDYNCGYCKKVLPELQALVKEDPNVKIVFKELPILGPSSELAAKWALAAHRQSKYFEFHSLLMKHQGQINADVLTRLATEAGLNVDKARQDAEGTEVLISLEQNRSLASQMNINGTPAFVLGEEIVPGALPLSEMKVKIQELRRKNAATGAPTPAPTPTPAPEKK